MTITGEHGLIRLGDLQRNATRILQTLMHSSQFEQLASSKGVEGIHVGEYGELFKADLGGDT